MGKFGALPHLHLVNLVVHADPVRRRLVQHGFAHPSMGFSARKVPSDVVLARIMFFSEGIPAQIQFQNIGFSSFTSQHEKFSSRSYWREHVSPANPERNGFSEKFSVCNRLSTETQRRFLQGGSQHTINSRIKSRKVRLT